MDNEHLHMTAIFILQILIFDSNSFPSFLDSVNLPQKMYTYNYYKVHMKEQEEFPMKIEERVVS